MARRKDRYLESETAPASVNRIWRAGIYTRISVDKYGEKKESLATQKMVAESFISRHPDIELVRCYEDDGISGTKFDRDDFVAMLEDIKAGEINTVIVKDLSRFGRNLEEVSAYLEKIFPFMQVRFISVNDHYDSIDPECDNKMLGIMISNLANDMYAKDASRKSSDAMRIRMESGVYCGGDAPYGYKRVKNGKENYTAVDPIAAPYVVQIFERIAEGESYSAVARSYNDMLLSPPRHYARTGELFLSGIQANDMHWCVSTVKAIAKNRHYLGNTYSHKTRTSLLTSEKNTLLAENEWHVHENTHEALISETLFQKVQEEILRRKKILVSKCDESGLEKSGKSVNKYIGLLKCGECGAGMARRCSKNSRHDAINYKYYYLCQNYLNVSRNAFLGNRWKEEVLDELVGHAIMNQMKMAEKLREQAMQFHNKHYKPYFRILERERAKILHLLEKNETARLTLYEEFMSGAASQAAYQAEKARLDGVKVQFQKRLGEIAVHEEQMKKLSSDNLKWIIDFTEGKSIKELTPEIVHAYIEEIRLYGDKRIEIVFKFQDEMLKLAEDLKEGMELCQMTSA